MRLTFAVGLLCLIGLALISGGSMLINVGAVALFASAALSAAAYLVIHASKRSSIKFDPGLYYKARNNPR